MKIEPIWQEQTQLSVFRELMDAMARPGTIRDIGDRIQGSSPYRSVLATLIDSGITVCDRDQLLPESDWTLLQIRSQPESHADFILCRGAYAPNFEPRLGTLSSPEQSATIVIFLEQLGNGNVRMKCNGPGIPGERLISLEGLHEKWLEKRNQWIADFPLGVDLIFADDSRIMAIPRTVTVEWQ